MRVITLFPMNRGFTATTDLRGEKRVKFLKIIKIAVDKNKMWYT
jgi:hypothetical protein